MHRRWIHLGLLVLVAAAIRFLVAFQGPGPHLPKGSWVTTTYAVPAYLIAADYGYKRPYKPTGEYWFGDSAMFERLQAYSLALDQRGLRIDSQHRPTLDESELRPVQARLPGYAAFLLLLYHVFGEPLLAWALAVQAILSSFYPVLVLSLAIELFRSERLAWTAAWATALYPAAAVTYAAEGMSTGLLLISVLCAARGARRRSYGWILASGLALGASCYFRTSAMYLWVFLGIALFIKEREWWRPLISTLILAGCVYASLLPWALRNHRLSGHLQWGASNTAGVMLMFIGLRPNPWDVRFSDYYITELARQQGFEASMTPDADEWFAERLRGYVREDPWFFVGRAFANLPLVLVTPFDAGLVEPSREGPWRKLSYQRRDEGLSAYEALRRHPVEVLRAYWDRVFTSGVSALASLSLLLLVVARWRDRGDVALLVALPAYYVAIQCVTGPWFVYLTPTIPFQMIALPAAAADLYGRFRFSVDPKRWLERGGAALLRPLHPSVPRTPAKVHRQ